MAHAEDIATALDKAAGGWDWSGGVSYNTALIFIKPHAVTEKTKEFVKSELESKGLAIVSEGELSAKEIESGGIIDNHYAAIASHAMKVDPADIKVADDKKAAFETTFGTSWAAALSSGTVLNVTKALEAMQQDGKGLAAVWDKGAAKVKLASGCYVSKCTYAMVNNDEGDDVGVPCEEGEEGATTVYLINGFYGGMRQDFVTEGASVYYYVVGFTSDKVSWKTFRNDIIGPTNPEAAPATSIRGQIFANFSSLGLQSAPNVGENGVHASAGPLEGLKERMVWLGLTPSTDSFGQKMLEVLWNDTGDGVLAKLLSDTDFEFAGKVVGSFDLTECTESLETLCICNNIAYATPEETKEFYWVEEKEEEAKAGAAPVEGEAPPAEP